MAVQPPSPPYLGPAKFHGGAQGLKPLKRIVIHGTVSPCKRGGARDIARYFANTVTRPSSAHYVIDPGEVVQVVGDHQVAYHAPPNTDSIGIEHCDPVAGDPNRWADTDHQAMLKISARTVAELCLAYDVPIRHVGPVGLRLGRRGITGHVDVSNAWHQTSHTDPGKGFPWRRYVAMVKAEAAQLIAGPPKPVVTPIPVVAPPTPKPVTMHLVTSNVRNNPDMVREHVRHDMAAVSKLGGVILWQEVAEPDDWADLRATLPEDEWQHIGMDDECPISVWRGKWQVRRSGRVPLHGGKAAVSPHRVAQWAELVAKGSSILAVPPVVVVNTHFVSGAYSHAGQLAEDWRVAMWDKAHAGLTALVADFHAQGLTVLGGGDFNRTGEWPGFAEGHRWLMHGGYDHLWCAEADTGARIRLDTTGTLGLDDLYTDHPARWAHVTVQPALPGKVHSS
jgi:hypothetical protein